MTDGFAYPTGRGSRRRGETRVLEIAGADHNDPALLDGQQLIAAVVELAERVSQPPEPARGTPPPPASPSPK